MPQNMTITGTRELVATLEGELTGAQLRRKMRSAKTKENRVIVKGLKAAVPSRLKSVRASVGHATKTQNDKSIVSKVGFGVGKSRRKTAPRRSSRGGVGISGRNVHWWVLGTGDRVTGDLVPTGSMPAQGVGILPSVMAATKSERERVVRDSLRKDIEALRAKT